MVASHQSTRITYRWNLQVVLLQSPEVCACFHSKCYPMCFIIVLHFLLDIFATGPRRKKKPTPSKPLPYSRRQNSTNDSSISPLLRRISRSHSFDNILDIGSPSEWAVNSDRVESPKPPRRIVLGSVIRTNTNASNNSKATAKNTNFSSDDQSDAYVELQGRIVTIETFTAMEGYVAQSDICLSFNTGDCCALLRKTDQNWWLVNIGGREGWVPGSFWTASSHVSTTWKACTHTHTNKIVERFVRNFVQPKFVQ